MYSRARCSLEALAKTTIRSRNLIADSRSFSSTTCARSVAVSRKTLSGRASPVAFASETLGQKAHAHPKQRSGGPDHSLRIKSAYPRLLKDRGPAREVHVAIKVKELCQAGKLEAAVDVCSNAPAALQGAAAWNTIIYHALSDGRYNYAYTLYQQMKKRHIIPTAATYTVFMSAYAQAKPEILTPIQLERAQNLYKDWVDLVLSAQTDSAVAAITAAHPAGAYISVLANAKLYQSIWDVFYDLDPEGPLAPDQFVFTNMLVAFAKRTTISNDVQNTTPSDATSEETLGVTDIGMKNAQDARLLWRMVDRSLERRPFPVDSHLVAAALRALQRGGQPELELALKIIDKYLGLRAPDAPAPSESIEPLEMNIRLLNSALTICNLARRPDLTRHFLDTLTSPEHPQRSIVNTGTMNLLLEAYASLGDMHQMTKTIDWMIREGALPGGLEVVPGSSSWCIALRACLATQDWAATKTLTKRLASTTNSKRMIDSETIYLVLKNTYVLKPENERVHERQLRQALDAVYYVVRIWPQEPNAVQRSQATVNPRRIERRNVFQNALGDLVKKVLDEFDGLRSIPGFDDLAYRLDRLRIKIPEEITARYKQEL